jgi:predicted ATPase
MSNAMLTSITVENFKSHKQPTTIKLSPLTVLVGPNNSGKSTIVQALLLLKQTLEFPRVEMPLHLQGTVEASSLRELTYGWPKGESFPGPRIAVRWNSNIPSQTLIEELGAVTFGVVVDRVGRGWLEDFGANEFFNTDTSLDLRFSQLDGRLILESIELVCYKPNQKKQLLNFQFIRSLDGSFSFLCNGEAGQSVEVNLDHFIPYVSVRGIGPRDKQRAWVNAFKAVFSSPLDDLKLILKNFHYLSSARALQPSIYRYAGAPPEGVGASGEMAAQLLQASSDKRVLYFLPSDVEGFDSVGVRVDGLHSAVSSVLRDLGVVPPLSIESIGDLGFRLLFGQATLQHVGRGLTYLLPIIEMGLIGDPTLFNAQPGREGLFNDTNFSVCAFEEPEAHLHPALQSRLADWFVALSLARRQTIVETHSDHIVRRIRALAAKSEPNGFMEFWFQESVSVIEVVQVGDVSYAAESAISAAGGMESWPKDFMGQAQEVEQEIYLAGLAKEEKVDSELPEVAHSANDEPYEPSN